MALRNAQRLFPARIGAFVDLPGGELGDVGKGVLSEASRLARILDCEWSVLCFAGASPAVLDEFSPYGVAEVILIEGPEHAAEYPELQARLLARAAADRELTVLLLSHDDLGGMLAPQIAAAMPAALFTEAVAFAKDAEILQLTRQSLGEQVAETRGWSGDTPLVLTVHLRILSAVVLPTMQRRQPKVVNWLPVAELAAGSTRIVERIPPDPQTVDVADAEVIISAGLGCNEQTFVQVQELTRLLNASLGVTRPVYDLGFAGFERMVGQTGKTVAPRLYLALGISGSMHHIGGIKDSKRIVSVNIDPKVPIFPNSDEGFVADLREVMPLLLERVRSVAGGEA